MADEKTITLKNFPFNLIINVNYEYNFVKRLIMCYSLITLSISDISFNTLYLFCIL